MTKTWASLSSVEDKPETAPRSRVPNTLETLRLEPEQAQRLAMESTSDALPTNPIGHAVPHPDSPPIATGKQPPPRPASRGPLGDPSAGRSTKTPAVSPLKQLLEAHAGQWKEVPSEPKIRLEDEATRPDLRAIRRPIRIARDGGFDEDQPTQPARHLSDRAVRVPKVREHAADPRMLLVGFPEGLELAVTDGLKRQSIRVVVGSPSVLSQVLLERVDFLVLYGDPRGNDVQRVLGKVSKLHLPALSGVLLVSDDTSLAARVLALRHGATSVIPRSASVGLLVERISHVAWGIELSDEQACEREATVEELVGTFAEELENRLRAPGESNDARGATRLVFSAARELPRLIDDMVQRVGVDIERVEHWDYELSARGSRAWIEDEAQPLSGTRVALLDDDSMRADAVAHELRERGAHVLVVGSDLTELGWSRLTRFDPMLLVFDSQKDEVWRSALRERQAADPSLHQAARAGVDLGALWKVNESFPNIEPLTRELGRVTQRLKDAVDRLRAGEQLAIAELGVSVRHLVRALANDAGCRLELELGERRCRAWLADGVAIGAIEVTSAAPHAQEAEQEQRVGEGLPALSHLLACRDGLLRLMPAPPSSGPPNLISPVDVALGQALVELRRRSVSPVSAPSLAAPPLSAPTMDAAPVNLAADGLPPVPARSTPPHPQAQPPLKGCSEPRNEPSAGLRPPIDPLRVQRRPARRVGLWLAAGVMTLGVLGGFFVWRHASDGSTPVRARLEVKAAPAVPPRQQTAEQSAAGKPVPPPANSIALPETTGSSAARIGLTEEIQQAAAETFLVRGQPVTDCKDEASALSAGQAVAQARRALMSGKLEAATEAYCAALTQLPEDAQLMTELARVFLQRGAGEQAVKWAKRAYELAPKTLNQVLLGDALALDGRFKEARAAWSEAWKIKSPATLSAIASAHFHTATRAAGQRDYAKAERFMRRVAVLDPARPDAPLSLAKVLLAVSTEQHLERFPEAKGWALRAAALNQAEANPDAWRASLEVLRDAARGADEPALAQQATEKLKP
ncbi:MAG: hypothetical protein H6716_27125 [Polyangiaceae bacterium]|nr:hypothetical protein [Polyangiaceae bacterium]